MTRSNMTTKFLLHTFTEYEKKFRDDYKRENDKQFAGNVIQYITVGVVQRKKLPDIDDCLLLIKLGNMKCSDEQAEAILERELGNDRTVSEIFCDLCTDLVIDIPTHKMIVEQIKQMPEMIDSMQEVMNQFNDMMTKLNDFKTKMKDASDNLNKSIEEADKQEDEKPELGVEKEDTQE